MTRDKHHNQHPEKRQFAFHKDWRAWAIGLMLISIIIYVLTLDEGLRPTGDQQSVPAAEVGQ